MDENLFDAIDTQALEPDRLSDHQRDIARQIFVAVMRRGFYRATAHMALTGQEITAAEATIQEWADLALNEGPRWSLN